MEVTAGTSTGESVDEPVVVMKSIRRLLLIHVLIVIGAVCFFAKDLMMPLALGLLITLTL